MGIEPSVTTLVTATRIGAAPTAPACCLVTAATVAYASIPGKRAALGLLLRYFFSNTTVLLTAWPPALVPLMVTVMVLPSFDTTR
jgi:hypothetical protein